MEGSIRNGAGLEVFVSAVIVIACWHYRVKFVALFAVQSRPWLAKPLTRSLLSVG